MYDLTPVDWLLAVAAAVGIGMAKAGFGGLGMLAILIMARVLPARESTGAILPMLILADVFAVYTYRAHAKGSLVLRMVPPALVGIICGWLLMPHIPAKNFGPFIGWLSSVTNPRVGFAVGGIATALATVVFAGDLTLTRRRRSKRDAIAEPPQAGRVSGSWSTPSAAPPVTAAMAHEATDVIRPRSQDGSEVSTTR